MSKQPWRRDALGRMEDDRMTTGNERQIGRAKNAVLQLLQRRLVVPKIYIDTTWDGKDVDLLAIERDGVGDVHAVLLLDRIATDDVSREVEMERGLIERLGEIKAQYKYIAAADITPHSTAGNYAVSPKHEDALFAANGLGRIGVLVVRTPENGEPAAEILIKPERFRAFISPIAEEYVQKHQADWEIRA